MVTSMAAALAASLPAPSATPAPVAPTFEAIPASMSKVIDVEAEIPLTCVQVDGMAISKILKHARDTASATAHGLLLGLDLDGTLEVSNSFPLPHQSSENEDDRSSKSAARYQASMLRSLKEVQSDDSVVGFYQATTLGAFFNQTLVDTQAIHQEKLRHGGIVIVHGKSIGMRDELYIDENIIDVSQTARGNASFRAFRLTSAFMSAHKTSNFTSTSLIEHSLTFSSILEEVPLKIRTNPLLSAFLDQLAQPDEIVEVDERGGGSALPPSFDTLNYGTGGLTKTLEQIVEAVDNYRTEEGNLAYMSRHIARERLKAETYVAKRKEENATRVAQGLAPLPEEDVGRLFKIPAEPSRLESLLLLGQIDAYGKSLEGTAGNGLVKMYSIDMMLAFHRHRLSPSLIMLSRLVLVVFCIAASANALSISHNHRGIAHRDVAHRVNNNSGIAKRPNNKKRCKARPTTVASSSASPAVAAVLSTSTTSSSTRTSSTVESTKAQPTTTVEPTTTKAQPTSSTKKAAATTSTTSSKAAATTAAASSSSDLPSFMVGTQTGQGTWYQTGLGACGITNTNTDLIAAASELLFDNYPGYNGENPNDNPMCGKQVKVTYNGNSVTVTLTDRCVACAVDSLDFSPSAFEQLAPLSVGRLYDIEWDWLD